MSVIAACLLALIVGITEFLPLSGSGQLFVFSKFFGICVTDALFHSFRAALYFGSAFGALLYYRTQVLDIFRDRLIFLGLVRPVGKPRGMDFGKRLGMLVLIATLPLVPALLLNNLRKTLETGPYALAVVSLLFGISGTILYFTTRGASECRGIHETELSDAALAGLFQVGAIFPGFSRTGIVLSILMCRDLEGPAAMELSGLMGIPALIAAGLVERNSASRAEGVPPETALLGLAFAVSALAVFFTIRTVTEWLSSHRPTCFSYWCWGTALLSLTLFLISA